MGRDVRVSFKLTEEKKEELERFANDYGVTMSGLCALIIGQWLHQQNKVIAPMVESIGAVLKEQMQQLMQDEQTVEELAKKMKQHQ